jgi:hypothetical protein
VRWPDMGAESAMLRQEYLTSIPSLALQFDVVYDF